MGEKHGPNGKQSDRIDSPVRWYWWKTLWIPCINKQCDQEAVIVEFSFACLDQVVRRDASIEQQIRLGKTEQEKEKGLTQYQVDGRYQRCSRDVLKRYQRRFKRLSSVDWWRVVKTTKVELHDNMNTFYLNVIMLKFFRVCWEHPKVKVSNFYTLLFSDKWNIGS